MNVKIFFASPLGTRAIRRFIPMMWIDQTIILNNETLERLQRVSLILEKGHYAHQSLKLVYIIIAFLSIIAAIIAIELFFFHRRVRFQEIEMKDVSLSSSSDKRRKISCINRKQIKKRYYYEHQ